MIYETVRPIVKFSLRQFFSSVKLKGAEPVESGPVIFVANHPNFMLDSLVVASVFERQLWFLAKSTLFREGLITRILEGLHMIPVYRRQDSASGKVDNDQTFQKVVDALASGKAVAMFPEGVSMGERRVMPLKTGAARMVFQAEEAADFKLGVKVQPIGLTYTDLEKFKSSVTVTFGEPIAVADYQSEYRNDAIEAVKGLTARIEQGIREMTVEVKDEQHVDLVEKIGDIYRSKDSKSDDHLVMRLAAENIEALKIDDNLRAKELIGKIDDYLDLASVFSLDGDASLDDRIDKLFILLSMPFVLTGIVFNYLPYKLVGQIANKISVHPVSIASYKLSAGVAIFPLWYLLLTVIFWSISGSFVFSLLFLLVLIASGYYVNNYLNQFKIYLLSGLWPGRKKPVEILKIVRDQLIGELEALRVR